MKSESNTYMVPSMPISGFLRKSNVDDDGNPMSTPFPQFPERCSNNAMSPGANR